MNGDNIITESRRSGRRWASGRILRPIVSLGLLILLLRGIDVSELLGLLSRANFLFISVGIVLILLALIVSAYKWQRLLDALNVRVPLSKLFVSYLVGLFFNNFLPTNIGGDVVRIHDVANYSGKNPEAVASVIGERLLAAFALALTAALGLVFSYEMSGRFIGVVIAVFFITLAFILLFGVKKIRKTVTDRIKLPEKFGLRRWLGGTGTSMGACLNDRRNVAGVILLSMVFHFIVVLINYLIFLSLGLNTPLVCCLLFIPIISAIQMLPISISGFGVREGAYVYFFGSLGMSAAEAVAASFFFWIMVALVSLAGGIIFALRR